MSERQISAKVVLLGESAVGKSSIVLQFVRGTFRDYQEATIGAAFLTQTILCSDPPRSIRFEMWDTAGQERYHSLAPMYYRGAQAAIIVYDITNSDTFDRAKLWVNEVIEQAPTVKVIALAGNKCDLDSKRAVDEANARAFAEEHSLLFLETSAKTCVNISRLFEMIAERLPLDSPVNSAGQQLLNTEPVTPSNKCCR